MGDIILQSASFLEVKQLYWRLFQGVSCSPEEALCFSTLRLWPFRVQELRKQYSNSNEYLIFGECYKYMFT